MTEIEARDLFGPFDDEEKITPEKRMGVDNSAVDHPAHYDRGKVECIDAIESAMPGLNGFEGFLVGNAVKYLWRWKAKGGITDLKKCRWYLDRLMSYLGEGNEN